MRKLLTGWRAFALAVMWLGVFSQTEMAAEIHGRLMPVTSPLQVTSVEPASIAGMTGSRIEGVANIKRGQCDYLSVDWRLDGDGKSVSVPAFFADPVEVRSDGQQTWRALMVGVPPERLEQTSGSVSHRCGIFPVTTPFFTPDDLVVPTSVGATAICNSGAYKTSTGPGTCSGHGGVKEYLNDVES